MEGRTAILVVEDELPIQRGLCDLLAFHGFSPTAVGSGDEGARAACAGAHDLVLLDVMLPGRSGYDVCREIRRVRPHLPVVMLTARGAEADILAGFEAGCDDYITKPFSVGEVVARVKAVLRRAAPAAADSFAFGPWRVDVDAMTASDGVARVELTRREIELLALFVRERGRIVGRRLLLREVWAVPPTAEVETRTVDVHIAKLRRKLARPGQELLTTVHGHGYRFEG